eukprot:360469-Chlamydomonas_euryale.AAC.1
MPPDAFIDMLGSHIEDEKCGAPLRQVPHCAAASRGRPAPLLTPSSPHFIGHALAKLRKLSGREQRRNQWRRKKLVR